MTTARIAACFCLLPLLLPACGRGPAVSAAPGYWTHPAEWAELPSAVDRILEEGIPLPDGLVWGEDVPEDFREPLEQSGHSSGESGDGVEMLRELHRSLYFYNLFATEEPADPTAADAAGTYAFTQSLIDHFAAPFLELGLEARGGMRHLTDDFVKHDLKLTAMNGSLRVDIDVLISRSGSRAAVVEIDFHYEDVQGVPIPSDAPDEGP